MKTVIIKIPTITFALKARKVLAAAGIRSNIVKDVSESDGCIYKLEFNCKDELDAIYRLKAAGIIYKTV